MARTFQTSDGSPDGCYPVAVLTGTTLTYTAAPDDSLASVTVFFNVYTNASGWQRDGFMMIECVGDGPTSDFAYSTVGDDGHASQYEIRVMADCSPNPPSPPKKEYACDSGECVAVQQPNKGIPKVVCDSICIKPDAKYACQRDTCVPTSDPTRGVDKATCEKFCGPQ